MLDAVGACLPDSEDDISGQGGVDTVDYSRLAYGVTTALTAGLSWNTQGAIITHLADVQNVVGTAQADSLTGDAQPSRFADTNHGPHPVREVAGADLTGTDLRDDRA